MANNVEFNGSITGPVETADVSSMQLAPKRNRSEASSSATKHEWNNFMLLSNDILQEIWGFLEVRQLVQLGTVAKQFRNCLKYGQKLDFNLLFQRALMDADQYQMIVGRIMDQHDGSKIRSLKLYYAPLNNSDNQAMVAHWINKASQKGVEELELNFDHGLEPFRVTPDLIFEIKTLETLRLVYIDVGSPNNEFLITGLRFLKICLMKKVNIEGALLDGLLKSCTELETLEIIKCGTPLYIKFSAGSLHKFKKLRLASCMDLREITLNAPSLITLHYSGQPIDFNTENCGNFIDFLIDFASTRWTHLHINHLQIEKLMVVILRIEILTTTNVFLERLCAKLVGAEVGNLFCYFPMAKEINLTLKGSRHCNLFTLAYFFSKFPCCERLFINVRRWLQDMQLTPLQLYVRQVFTRASSVVDQAVEQEEQLPPPLQMTEALLALANRALDASYLHLEQLKLTGFRFAPDEMELLCYFLRTAPNLKTVAIFTASPRHWLVQNVPEEPTFNHILRQERIIASPDLQIRILQHKQEKKLYPATHPKNWRKG